MKEKVNTIIWSRGHHQRAYEPQNSFKNAKLKNNCLFFYLSTVCLKLFNNLPSEKTGKHFKKVNHYYFSSYCRSTFALS